MAEYSGARTTRNRSWDTKQLVTMALLCALSVLLSFIELPLIPAVPFLKYDASLVPVAIGGFTFGPGAGICIGLVSAAIHGVMCGDLPGAVMNMLVTVGYVLPASLIYRKRSTWKRALLGLIAGSLCAIIAALLGNLAITPLYMGVPLESVLGMLIPILLPFNALKAVANSALTLIVLKSIRVFMNRGKKSVS